MRPSALLLLLAAAAASADQYCYTAVKGKIEGYPVPYAPIDIQVSSGVTFPETEPTWIRQGLKVTACSGARPAPDVSISSLWAAAVTTAWRTTVYGVAYYKMQAHSALSPLTGGLVPSARPLPAGGALPLTAGPRVAEGAPGMEALPQELYPHQLFN